MPAVEPNHDDLHEVVTADFTGAAETLAMMGSPVRIQLLWVLSRGEHDVSSLASCVDLPLATISHHLRKMRAAGLVTSRAEGRHRVYGVDDPHIVELTRQAIAHHADLRLRSVEN